MQRDAFENLISEWLDSRDDVARAKLDALVADSPELRLVLDEWLRFDAILHESMPRVEAAVHWPRLQTHISRAIDTSISADLRRDSIDRLLDPSDDLEARVDWSKLRDRISASARRDEIRRDAAQQSTIGRILGFVTVAVAAAAMLIVYVSPQASINRAGDNHMRSFVRLTIEPDPSTAPRKDAQVRVMVVDDAPAGASPAIAAAGEIFLMIDPIAPGAIDPGALGSSLSLN